MITRSHEGAPPALNVATDLTGTIAALYRDGLNPEWNLLYPNGARAAHRLSGYSFSTANRFWIKERTDAGAQPATFSAAATDSTKDSTMDNLIALFREQAAVLAAYGQGKLPPIAPAEPALQANPAVDTTAIVRAEIARVSGFPEKNLRTTQTIRRPRLRLDHGGRRVQRAHPQDPRGGYRPRRDSARTPRSPM
jgi:hypothetical protein